LIEGEVKAIITGGQAVTFWGQAIGQNGVGHMGRIVRTARSEAGRYNLSQKSIKGARNRLQSVIFSGFGC